jgi:hypothetical protein
MAEYCSCGAQLPPDALFCHKCGKPQREIVSVEPPPEPVEFNPPPPSVRPEPAPLNFHNPVALRIAAVVAASATILSFVLPFVNWLAGGFFVVLFYRRRTGSLLNVRAGMRLGWITGVLAFVPSALVFAIEGLPRLGPTIEQQMKSLQGQDPAMVQQMTQFFQSPPGLAAAAMFSLGAMFVLITMLSMAGGALGAKVIGHN